MTRKRGLWPPPVYVAQLADGETVRLSFWSPAGKPVDVTAGRRAAEELLLTDWQAPVTWERSRGYWRALRARRETAVETVQSLTGYAAWDYRVSRGRLSAQAYGPGDVGWHFIMGDPAPTRELDHGAIVRRFVEHDTIPGGKIEDTGAPERAAPKRAGERAAKRAAQIPASPDPARVDLNADLLTALANIAARGAQGEGGKVLAKMARAALIKCGVVKTAGANGNTEQRRVA